MKSIILFYSVFNRERRALVLTSWKDLIFITQSITVQPTFLPLNGKLGVICMIEAKNAKKN